MHKPRIAQARIERGKCQRNDAEMPVVREMGAASNRNSGVGLDPKDREFRRLHRSKPDQHSEQALLDVAPGHRGPVTFHKARLVWRNPLQLLVLMPMMQFRQVRVIMGEGQVPVRVRMWPPNKISSLRPVVVMIFVLMNMVVF